MYTSIKQANKRSNDWCPRPRSVLKLKPFFFRRKNIYTSVITYINLSIQYMRQQLFYFLFSVSYYYILYRLRWCSLLQGNRFCCSGNIRLLLGMQTIIIFVSLSWKQTETVDTIFCTRRLVRCQSWRQCLT